MNIDNQAFSPDSETWFESCNTGTVTEKSKDNKSFAQEWSDETGLKTIALADGRTDYQDIKKRDEIIVIGNVPKEINHNILRNIFVFEGKYLGVKNRKGCKHDLKTFEAENWFIKYPIERIPVEKYYPKNGLSLLDILDAEVMPVHEIVEDEN